MHPVHSVSVVITEQSGLRVQKGQGEQKDRRHGTRDRGDRGYEVYIGDREQRVQVVHMGQGTEVTEGQKVQRDRKDRGNRKDKGDRVYELYIGYGGHRMTDCKADNLVKKIEDTKWKYAKMLP